MSVPDANDSSSNDELACFTQVMLTRRSVRGIKPVTLATSWEPVMVTIQILQQQLAA